MLTHWSFVFLALISSMWWYDNSRLGCHWWSLKWVHICIACYTIGDVAFVVTIGNTTLVPRHLVMLLQSIEKQILVDEIYGWPFFKWVTVIYYAETEMLHFGPNFRHWLHRKLSKWQLPVQPVMKNSNWQYSHFSVVIGTNTYNLRNLKKRVSNTFFMISIKIPCAVNMLRDTGVQNHKFMYMTTSTWQ